MNRDQFARMGRRAGAAFNAGVRRGLRNAFMQRARASVTKAQRANWIAGAKDMHRNFLRFLREAMTIDE